MVANQIPKEFRGNGSHGNGNARSHAQSGRSDRSEGSQATDERPWVQLPGSCNMVLVVPDALLQEIARTQRHAQTQGRSGEQLSYAIRTTVDVRSSPGDGGEPRPEVELRMFISADERGRVSYEGTYGFFRFVLAELLDRHIARSAASAEAKEAEAHER